MKNLPIIFPTDQTFEIKMRKYQFQIENLERKVLTLKTQVDTANEQNVYYIDIIQENNELIHQLQGVIHTLETLLVNVSKELKNEINQTTV